MQKLQTVNADTLLYEPLEKPSFVVDGLIPTGLTLFCGSQKIGKSWLMLKLYKGLAPSVLPSASAFAYTVFLQNFPLDIFAKN